MEKKTQKIKIKFLIDEDFINYKKPSMFIGFPNCSFKCDLENGNKICQNSSLISEPNIKINIEEIVNKYLNNLITNAIVCAGLEPFDSELELIQLILAIRAKSEDDIVIYTGYTEEELQTNSIHLQILKLPNIIIKYGRFIPNQKPHFDKILDVNLASDNQYAQEYNIKEK